MAQPNFSVRIIWESDRHFPVWEIQTEHPGFTNWMAPALFAHGCTAPHPVVLRVAAGVVTLVLNTGAELQLAGDGGVLLTKSVGARSDAADPRASPGLAGITLGVWQLDPADPDLEVAVCESYREHAGVTPAALSRAGLDGMWRPQSYEVFGPTGHVPVVVEVHDAGTVSVRLERDYLLDSEAETTRATVIRA